MIELKENIFYVGIKAPSHRTTYNAYLVRGEKNALIETVCADFADDYIKNISEIMPVSEIDYLVCTHTEPDHSGCVGKILELNPDIEVVSTIAAIKNLQEITNKTFNEHTAKHGARINLGKGMEAEFCITPNLPWPDTMVTYIEKAKTLFSCDIFAANYIADTVSDANVDENSYRLAAKTFFTERIYPFRPFMRTALEKISGFDFDMICAGHGPVLEKFSREITGLYKNWCEDENKSEKKAAVFYVSRYGYTAEMAKTVSDTLTENGFDAELCNASENAPDSMLDVLNKADILAFGSPTINKNAAKDLWDIITRADLINIKGKPCMIFGSYGWGGEGLTLLYKTLQAMRLKVFDKPFGVILKPSGENIDGLQNYTRRFAEYIKKEI